MKTTFWTRLDVSARRATPVALTILLVLIAVVPYRLPAFPAVTPAVALVAVYHWALYRPDLLPVGAVFLIGLLQDALTDVPLGVNAAILVAVHGIVTTQRRFFAGKGFPVTWFGFIVMAAAAFVASWILVCLFYLRLIAPAPLLFQLLMTIGIFPMLSWAFSRWQMAILERV